jgi:hypothetical protein
VIPFSHCADPSFTCLVTLEPGESDKPRCTEAHCGVAVPTTSTTSTTSTTTTSTTSAVCVDDDRFPFAFVSIRGRARVERRTPSGLLPWTTRISRRYVGDDRADVYGRRNAVEGGVLVRVSLDHVVAVKNVAL